MTLITRRPRCDVRVQPCALALLLGLFPAAVSAEDLSTRTGDELGTSRPERSPCGHTRDLPAAPRPSRVAAADVRAATVAASTRRSPWGRIPVVFEPAGGGGTRRFVLRWAGYNALLGAADLLVAPRSTSPPLRVRFAGADPRATMEGTERLPGKSNYFFGDDPGRWRVGVPMYARVTVEGIYPGIDLEYHGRDRGRAMEFDFLIAPGADPGRIAIEVAGEHDFEVDAGGGLVMRTPEGEFRLGLPHVYQKAGGRRRAVPGRYVSSAGNPRRIGFQLGAYDRGLPLVIDPVLAFASRLGGSDQEDVEDIAVDAGGNVYVTGSTRSIDLTAPAGEDPGLLGSGGERDAFIVKLGNDGSTVLYSTFLGGTGDDEGLGIGVDGELNVYVAGETSPRDTGFPATAGAYRTSAADLFVSKLDPAGALVYSTFFGGLNIASLGGFAVSGSGDSARVFLTGKTARGFPTTAGAFRRSLLAQASGFLSILEPGQEVRGEQLVYSTLWEGFGLAVAAGPNGTAYVTGHVPAPASIPVRHGFDPTMHDPRDSFLAVFDPSQEGADSLLYSTYIGGSREENGTARDGGIAVGPSGVALVAGTTGSFDFPVTPEGLRTSRRGSDGFLVVIDPSLPGADSLLYGTYLGGTSSDRVTDIAAGPRGIAYVVGITSSTDLPAGEGGIAPKLTGGSPGAAQDAFVVKIDWTRAGGDSLIDAAYIGGTAADSAYAVAAASNTVHVAGVTDSNAVFQPNAGLGGRDGFVACVRTTIQLHDGAVGVPSTEVLSADFGTGPHAWTLVSGALPPGLELSSDGTLSGEPTEAGSSTFGIEVADALGVTRERTYRKRVRPGTERGDVLIRKSGPVPVPGRTFPYRILLRNRSDRTLYNVGVVELLEPYFDFVSSVPAPVVIEPKPGHVYWTIPRLDPGELAAITYRVSLPPEFPDGVDVDGTACLTEDDCNDRREECYDFGDSFCDTFSCHGFFSTIDCIKCRDAEKNKCDDEYFKCKNQAQGGTSEVLDEGSQGGCANSSRNTDRAFDPNEKDVSSGPFIPAGEILGYTIHFENLGGVEARDVFLTDVLDADLDLSTVWVSRRLGGLERLTPDSTVSIFDDDGEQWNVMLDSASRTISWELLNIDLPPDESESVFFVVQAPEDLPTGTEIRNEASIRFEQFETIVTNETLNTVDTTAPTGTVEPLPAKTFAEEFEVSWTGSDPVGEIEALALLVSTDGGPFELVTTTPGAGSTTFTGKVGSTYGFLCLARDTAGNVEPMDGVAETTTSVETPPVPFLRGDCNDDGGVDISDAIRDLLSCFSGASVSCRAACDIDGDGDPCTGVTDGVRLLAYLFRRGDGPPEPFPSCGTVEETIDCETPPTSCR